MMRTLRRDLGRDDPLGHLARVKQIADRWTTEAEHRVAIGVEQSAETGEVRTRPSYDGNRLCPECGPRIAQAEVERYLEGFGTRDVWVDVVRARQVDSAVRSLRQRELLYVAVPVFRGWAVILALGPWTIHSLKVENLRRLLSDLVMPSRVTGRRRLRSSRGLLPAARPSKLFEAFSPGTSRRCWHCHPTKDAARECAHTHEARDGGGGWQVRPTSEFRDLGTLTRPWGLREQLDAVRVKHWQDPSDDDRIVTEPLRWNDPRFVEFRRLAGWRKPGRARDDWLPPPLAIQMTITVAGDMTG